MIGSRLTSNRFCSPTLLELIIIVDLGPTKGLSGTLVSKSDPGCGEAKCPYGNNKLPEHGRKTFFLGEAVLSFLFLYVT